MKSLAHHTIAVRQSTSADFVASCNSCHAATYASGGDAAELAQDQLTHVVVNSFVIMLCPRCRAALKEML